MIKLSDLSGLLPTIDSVRKNAGGASGAMIPADQRHRLVAVTGDTDLGGVISATIAAQPTLPFAAGDVYRAMAWVTWGSGGAFYTAEVDIRDGTIISLPASSLQIDVLNEGTFATTQLEFNAAVTYLPKGGAGPVRRTRYQDAQIAGAAAWAAVVVPAFATHVSVVRTPQNAPYVLDFNDSNGVLCYQVNVIAGADAFRIPLSNDIRTVDLNNGAVAIPRARMIFDLVL